MKIFSKSLLFFLFISLAPVLVITVVVYNRYKSMEIENSIQDLTEISKSRIQYISRYFTVMENKALIMARTENVTSAMTSLEPISESTEELFRLFTKVNEIEDVFLINPDGSIRYSTLNNLSSGESLLSEKNKDTLLEKVFSEVKYSLSSAISEFDQDPGTNIPAIFIGAPIFKNGEFNGVFAFRIPPIEIYKIFHDYTSLGKTGEVLIAVKKGNEILFVNPLRNRPDAAFHYTVEIGSDKALPMQEALGQRDGSGISVDYRYHDVLAVWQYFPKMHLGIVVKIDLDEALIEVTDIRNLLILISSITLIIVVLLVVVISKIFSRPIEKLRRATREIAAGRLDTKIEADSSDELGDLAKEFKSMVAKLKSSTTSVDRLNEEIEKNKNLLQANEELISRVSHELRTPLTPIGSGVKMLLKDEQDQEKKELLQIVDGNVKRLLTLINEIIDYRKIKIKEINKQNRKFCSINKLINESIESRNEVISQKQLNVDTFLESNLPEIELQKDQIKEVILSLLDNAIKFTDQGGITIRSKADKKNIIVSIQDSGIGIGKEDLPKLFQSFRELKMITQEKKQGFGVSLAKCKEIIDSHNGKIWAESEEGVGSIFTFLLPTNKDSFE